MKNVQLSDVLLIVLNTIVDFKGQSNKVLQTKRNAVFCLFSVLLMTLSIFAVRK